MFLVFVIAQGIRISSIIVSSIEGISAGGRFFCVGGNFAIVVVVAQVKLNIFRISSIIAGSIGASLLGESVLWVMFFVLGAILKYLLRFLNEYRRKESVKPVFWVEALVVSASGASG